LIVNADDLGLTAGVNRGIAVGLRSGALTSATLMAMAPEFEDAVGHLERLGCLPPNQTASGANGTCGCSRPGKLSIGCHVVLVDGCPALPAASVSSLLGASSQEFQTTFSGFARRVLLRRLQPDQITAEAEAQMRRIQAAGIILSHVDTHKHVHLFPAVLRAVLRAARARGVRAIRNPFAPVKPLAFAHLLRRPHLWTRYSEVTLLRRWSESFRRTVREEGMITTDGTFGIMSTGALDLELFSAIVGCIPPGTWEFCCHPGYHDADLARTRTRLRESRERELALLTSSEARDTLARSGIELIGYWDLNYS
jgi:predicted glycoside hydrolase/deacetylase ChbG (UPF0249 family)